MKALSFKFRKGIASALAFIMALTLIPVGMLGKPTKVLAGEFVDGLAASEVQVNTSYYYDLTQCSDIANTYSKGLFSFSAGSYHGASYKDTTYGVEFKSGNKLTFPVAGNSTIIVGGDSNNTCTDLAATSSTGTFEPATLSTVTAGHATLDDCKTKGSNTLVYEYTGTKGNITLTLDPSYTKAQGQTSTKAYIAYVCIIPNGDQSEGENSEFEDALAASEIKVNTSYYYDLTQCSDIANTYSKGLFSFSAGSYHGASYKDTTYGVEFKSGNKLTFPVAGNSTIIVGGDSNNTCTDLAATSSTGTFEPATLSTVTAGHATLDDCKTKGSNTLVYEYTGTKGNITLTLDPSYTKAQGQTSTKAYIAYVCIIPNGDQSEGGDPGTVAATREVKYDFTNNTGKAAPKVGSILAGTDTSSEGILYVAQSSTNSGCTFDSSQLRFRADVTLYLPIKDDTTKVTYTYLGAGNNAGRPTYLGSKDSGYQLEYNNVETSCTIDDITDYIVVKGNQKYFPIVSGGDIKIKYITLTEYNPINSVSVSGNIENAATNGVTEIKFKNLDNEKADIVKATVDASGNYSTVLRRVAGNTNYVASISNPGFKIDDTDGANKFKLTGNEATAIQNFKVVTAPIAKLSGTLTGVPEVAIIGGDFKVELVPEDAAYESVEVPLTKSSDGNYLYSNVNINPSQTYKVVLTNADDYEVLDTIQKEEGTYADVKIIAQKKPLLEVSGEFVTSDKKNASVSKITFTNMDTPNYKYTGTISGNTYSINLRAGEYETTVECNGYTAFDHVSVKTQNVKNNVYLQGAKDTSATTYKPEVNVGVGEEFETISEAVDYISRMTRGDSDRVTIYLKDSVYREQVVINTPNITIKGNGATVTWYYGVGFSYYSAKLSGKDMYYDEAYAVDKYYKGTVSQNPGHWGATVNLLSGATGFRAEDLTFENSLNRYLTTEEIEDGASSNVTANITDRTTTNIDVRAKASKERACVIYIQADDTEYKECKFLSSQDTIYTGDATENSYFKNCLIEGTTDYICGDGNPVFDECVLSMYSYSDQDAVGSFIVASKEKGQHGYLFNNCKIVTTSDSGLKPTSGNYLARAWGAGTVVFYNTEVESADMICDVAYSKMNVAVDQANYSEYKTHTPEGTLVDTSGRPSSVNIMDDAAAQAVNIEDYFDGWRPKYYFNIEEVTVVPNEDGAIPVEGVKPDKDTVFVDENGIVVTDGTIVVKADDIAPADKTVMETEVVAKIDTTKFDISGVSYIDINALMGGVKVNIKTGKLTITVEIPSSITYDPAKDSVKVLHKTSAGIVEHTVTKGTGKQIRFEVSSLSPFAIVVYSEKTVTTPADDNSDDDGDDDKQETATTAPTVPVTPVAPVVPTESATEAGTEENVGSAETGDRAPIALFMLLAVLSAGALAVTSKKRV